MYLQHRKHAQVTVVASMRQGAQTGVVVENELTRQSRESPSGRETSICRDLAPWEGGLSRQLHVINCHRHRAEVASGRVTRNGADALGKGQVIWTLLIKECGCLSEEARKPVKNFTTFPFLLILWSLLNVIYGLEPRQRETSQEAVAVVQVQILRDLNKGSGAGGRVTRTCHGLLRR